MGKPVVHFEIYGKDRIQAQQFYQSLFDWKINDDNPFDYGMVETGGEGGINGGISGSQDGTRVMVYVQVDDPQAYLDKAESLGGQTIMPVTEIPNAVTLAQFVDPDGNRVGLVKG